MGTCPFMSRTIFWSWQSDRDERVNRNLIREALVIALDRLSNAAEIEDRLEIDHDTRGLPGSPDIVASILAKIDAADVFVADITPIAVSSAGKHIANPNVLIELGYAKKSLGQEKWITVWNTDFTKCKVEDLPFDLRGRRGPISYTLAAGADKEDLRKVRVALVEQFSDRLRACLSEPKETEPHLLKWHPNIDGDQSTWVYPGTEIDINEGWGSGSKTIVGNGRWFVRILPSVFDPSHMNDGAQAPPVIEGGFSRGDTAGGVLTYSGSVRAAGASKELSGATMWFRNTGEVWFTHGGISTEYKDLLCFFGDYVPEKWASNLWYGLNFLSKNGGKGPYHVRLGVTGLGGLYWDRGNRLGGYPPKALQSFMEKEFVTPTVDQSSWIAQFTNCWTELRQIFSLLPPNESEVKDVLHKCR